MTTFAHHHPGRSARSEVGTSKALRLIREKGPMSRAALGAWMGGPSPVTLSLHIKRLEKRGEIEVDASGVISAKKTEEAHE